MLTNLHNIPLPVQVWLAADEYNAHKEITKYLSATTILRPLKSVILGRRVDPNTVAKDVTDFIAVRRGTAIHDSIEKVWNDDELRASAMRKLGYPNKVIEMYKVNDPTPIDQRLPKTRYVDMEQRAFKKIGDWTIGGQFDFICDGMLFDFKTTSTYAKMNDGHDRDYCIQGSIYRWLNPDIIKGDFLTICFITPIPKSALLDSIQNSLCGNSILSLIYSIKLQYIIGYTPALSLKSSFNFIKFCILDTSDSFPKPSFS